MAKKKKKNNDKKIIIFVIIAIIIVGLIYAFLNGKDKNEKQEETTEITEETTSETIESTAETTTEDKKEPIANIDIYTINGSLDMLKEKMDTKKFDKTVYFEEYIPFLQNSTLKKANVPNNETIRIDLQNNVPKDLKVVKVCVRDDTNTFENVDLTEKEKGIIDFANKYDINDKNLKEIIYSVVYTSNNDNVFIYSIRINIEKKKEPIKEKTVNILTEDEQMFYDEYKKEKDENVLLEIDPISVAKFYVQAIFEKEYNLSYALLINSDDKNTNKQAYINAIKGIDKKEIELLKGIKDASFVETDKNNGYAEYAKDKKINLQKNERDIWKIQKNIAK